MESGLFIKVTAEGEKGYWWMLNDYFERVVDRLPLMTYGLKLRLEAWILKFKNFNLSFKEII